MPQTRAGTSRLMAMIRGTAGKVAVDLDYPPPETGLIDESYNLIVDRSHDSTTSEPFVFKPGEYQLNRMLTLPRRYFAATPNGARTVNEIPGGSPTPYDPPPDPVPEVPPVMAGGHAQFTGTGLHDHLILTPPELAPIQPWDRVLLVWINDGSVPVVVCPLISGELYAEAALTRTTQEYG